MSCMTSDAYQPVDLAAYRNAGVELLAGDHEPAVGSQVFHGLPFRIGEGHSAFVAFGADLGQDPRTIPINDRGVENHWQTLFDANPRWWCRQIAYIVRDDPKQYLTLLAARLIYPGGPWNRRATAQ